VADLLILGVGELSKEDTSIFAYNFDCDKYIKIKRKKSLVLGNEINEWNPFCITSCSLSENRDHFMVIGEPVLKEQLDFAKAKDRLRRINKSIDKFLHQNNEIITLVSADKVVDLVKDIHDYKIVFFIRGNKYTFYLRDEKLLSCLQKHDGDFEVDRNKVMGFINKEGNDTYLLISRDRRLYGLYSI